MMKSQKNDGWIEGYRLGDGCSIKHGFAFKGKHMTTNSSVNLPIVVNIVNFKYNGGFRFHETKIQRYDGNFPGEYILNPDDILLVMTCQTPGGEILGIPGRIPDDTETYLHNQRMGLVQINKKNELDHDFLYYLFLSPNFNRHLFATSTGSKILHTAPSRIENFVFDLPPLDNQKKIGYTLSMYDELIDNNWNRIQILEEMMGVIFRDWFVHFRFPGYRKIDLIDSELGMIPEGWEVSPFSAIADFQNGYAFKPRHWMKEGKPIVKIAEMKKGLGGTTSYYHGDDIPLKNHITTGNLLFAWSASLHIAYWTGGNALLNQHIFDVVPKDGFTLNFLYHTLYASFDHFQSKTQGSTMKHIRRTALDEVKTIIPPINLRDQFEKLTKPMLELALKFKVINKDLTELRDLLLPILYSGQIDISQVNIEIPTDTHQTSKYS